MGEVAVASARCGVFAYVGGNWQQKDTGFSSLGLYHNKSTNMYRVVAMDEKNGACHINSNVVKGQTFQKSTAQFLSWSDAQSSYGCSFPTPADCDKFNNAVQEALKALNYDPAEEARKRAEEEAKRKKAAEEEAKKKQEAEERKRRVQEAMNRANGVPGGAGGGGGPPPAPGMGGGGPPPAPGMGMGMGGGGGPPPAPTRSKPKYTPKSFSGPKHTPKPTGNRDLDNVVKDIVKDTAKSLHDMKEAILKAALA